MHHHVYQTKWLTCVIHNRSKEFHYSQGASIPCHVSQTIDLPLWWKTVCISPIYVFFTGMISKKQKWPQFFCNPMKLEPTTKPRPYHHLPPGYHHLPPTTTYQLPPPPTLRIPPHQLIEEQHTRSTTGDAVHVRPERRLLSSCAPWPGGVVPIAINKWQPTIRIAIRSKSYDQWWLMNQQVIQTDSSSLMNQD